MSEGKRYTLRASIEDRRVLMMIFLQRVSLEPDQRSMKRKETCVDIYRSKNHCSLVSSPDLPYCMCTVIEFTPGEGILDLLSFDNYYRSPLFASSYSIRVFFSFFSFFFTSSFWDFSISVIRNFRFLIRQDSLFLIYFTISQLLLVNRWKSYRVRDDNHFNGIDNLCLIRFEWKDIYIYIYISENEKFPCVILRIT